jgi:hypothetical protein
MLTSAGPGDKLPLHSLTQVSQFQLVIIARSLLGKFRELRERTLPSSILPYKNVCRPLLRGEDLPAEFTPWF